MSSYMAGLKCRWCKDKAHMVRCIEDTVEVLCDKKECDLKSKLSSGFLKKDRGE